MNPRGLGALDERIGLVEITLADRDAGLAEHEIDIVARQSLRGGGPAGSALRDLSRGRFDTANQTHGHASHDQQQSNTFRAQVASPFSGRCRAFAQLFPCALAIAHYLATRFTLAQLGKSAGLKSVEFGQVGTVPQRRDSACSTECPSKTSQIAARG
jgi:hypothetical protein